MNDINFGALLYFAWEASDTDELAIKGRWAEDGSEYIITVPRQLRDHLVRMQRQLHHSYKQIEELDRDLRAAKSAYFSLLGRPNEK